jgi:tetratricopeptide (TPR) repeat protein
MSETSGRPVGSVYDWYVRGLALLESGDPAAAVHLLTRAAAAEPGSASVREALGRARLASRQWDEARADFAFLVDAAPDDDYARFGLGLALARLGQLDASAEQLALAVAMRPDRQDYARYLREVRATRAARTSVGGASADGERPG